ncbi:MAG: hypothetical protein HY815_08230 [Candidatus Riflebacteria bacterium]|nr:hypothetical protein [Candidatus Riflebacteria bacterium]
MKASKSLKIAALLVALAIVLPLGGQGCGNSGGLLSGLLSGLVNLGGGGGLGGAIGTGGGFGPGSPENTGSIPGPGAGTAPPSGVNARQPPQVGTDAGAQELQQKHGIAIRGAYTQTDVQNTLMCAQQYRPEETNGVEIEFSSGRSGSGVLGMWSGGRIEIYGEDIDVILHELSHHITLTGSNRSSSTADQVIAAARQAGGGQIPSSCITRDYATTDEAEFIAEFLTGLAGLERGVPLTFTIQNGYFNPPESVRQVARQIYVSPTAS